MAKIAIISPPDKNWMGGVNYFRNLSQALRQAPGAGHELIVYCSPETAGLYEDLSEGCVRIAVRPWLSEGGWLDRLDRLCGRLFRLRPLCGPMLRRDGIDWVFASGADFRGFVRIASWIPDFQHLHKPEFFSARTIALRNWSHSRQARFSDLVVLSSEDAAKDFRTRYKTFEGKARILRFAVDPRSFAGPGTAPASVVREGPWLFLPNQFWQHKNHGLVFEALALLKAQGRHLSVICTGHTQDPRDGGYFGSLMERVRQQGIDEQVVVLGRVSQQVLLWCYKNCNAVINPSYFEGWSTTVEEAKALGRPLVLSDLPVHREQAGDFGHFFDPHSPVLLAKLLTRLMDENWGIGTEISYAERFIKFGLDFHGLFPQDMTNRNSR